MFIYIYIKIFLFFLFLYIYIHKLMWNWPGQVRAILRLHAEITMPTVYQLMIAILDLNSHEDTHRIHKKTQSDLTPLPLSLSLSLSLSLCLSLSLSLSLSHSLCLSLCREFNFFCFLDISQTKSLGLRLSDFLVSYLKVVQ
jgi:hypothetical protein